MDELYTKPGHLIRRMQQIAVAIFMEDCGEFVLTPVQYATLVAIDAYPGVDATRLSALIAFDRSTLGSVLGRLEEKKYIQRRASNDDSRVKLLYLTDRGRAILAAAAPAVERAQQAMLAPLRPGDRRKLLQLLAQLVDLNNDASRAPLHAIGQSARGSLSSVAR
jgi:MarR family transcriptional regulator, lower aerobic nicotinate degradation pathway regulator